MKRFHNAVSICLIASLVLCLRVPNARAESVDDCFPQISPKHLPGSGEYVHGTGYGKILMRVMMFGALPQQGIHYFPEGTDLLFALLYSGGKQETTKLNGITIRRRNVTDLVEVELEDLIESGAPIPKLVDGDVVSVPFNWRRDYQTFLFLTGVFSSISGFILAIVALRR